MPVLGVQGKIQLRREAPEPVLLTPNALHRLSNSLYVRNPAYWSGDAVSLSCDGGLPIDAGEGLAACPDGYAVYAGSDWELGPNRAHITDHRSRFYTEDDDALFYATEAQVGLIESTTVYIYRDQLDRLSFYPTHEASLRGAKADRIPLHLIDFGAMVLAPLGSLDYQNALLSCSSDLDLGDYQAGYIQDEVALAAVSPAVPDYQPPEGSADEVDDCPDSWLWTIQGDMSEWSLNLTAQEVDTTAVGEKFGDSVKSVVTGGGSIDFLVSRRKTLDQTGAPMADSTSLMRLLLLSEKGCKADAEFWMIDGQEDRDTLLPGDLFYQTQVLVTSIAINTRATDIIAGSLNFVTVGEIRLLMGTN